MTSQPFQYQDYTSRSDTTRRVCFYFDLQTDNFKILLSTCGTRLPGETLRSVWKTVIFKEIAWLIQNKFFTVSRQRAATCNCENRFSKTLALEMWQCFKNFDKIGMEREVASWRSKTISLEKLLLQRDCLAHTGRFPLRLKDNALKNTTAKTAF